MEPKKARNSEESNLKVIVRFRPLINIELELSETKEMPIEYIDMCTVGISKQTGDRETFNFDKVFPPSATQEEIFEFVGKPIVEDVLTGYNGTVFAYGQTGSGKTFTMMGISNSEPESQGIIPKATNYIFKALASSTSEIKYTIKCSMLEIYKETLKDLLGNNGELKIKQDKRKGIYVQSLTEVYVVCEEEMMEVLALGESNRTVASTKMNTASSRSHQLFIVELTQKMPNDSEKRGILNLVDLAGSEKINQTGVTGNKLEEAKKINLSLSALGNVIKSLTDHAEHIPYRDSKLTRLLQESLGGNYKTTLIVNCSPHPRNIEDTINTLKFAQRAKTIKNKAKLNIKKSAEAYIRIIEDLKKQLATTMAELEAYKTGDKPIQNNLNTLSAKSPTPDNISFDSRFSDLKYEENAFDVEELFESLNSLKQDNEYACNKIKELEEELEYERKKRIKTEKECFDYTMKYKNLLDSTFRSSKDFNFSKDESESFKKQIDILKFHLIKLNYRYSTSLAKLKNGQEISEWEFTDMSQFQFDKNSKLPVYTEEDMLEVSNTSELAIDIPINEKILISNDRYAQNLCQQLENGTDVKKDLLIFELKKQFIDSSFANCELSRAYYEILWKYKLLREKMNLKSKVIATQEERINTLEKMIDSLNNSFDKILEILEVFENNQSAREKTADFARGNIIRFVKPSPKPEEKVPLRKSNRTGTTAPFKFKKIGSKNSSDQYDLVSKGLFLESNLQIQTLYNNQLKKANEIITTERNSYKSLLNELIKENSDVYSKEKERWKTFLNSFKDTCEKELIRKQIEINKLNELLGEWMHKYMEIEGVVEGKYKSLNNKHKEDIVELLMQTKIQIRPSKILINESPLHCKFKTNKSTFLSNITGDSSPPNSD